MTVDRRSAEPAHYAVFGHPVAHSKSPFIHTAFAAQTQQAMQYGARLAPLDGFAHTVQNFFAAGGRGCNVTLPFKEQAFALAHHTTARAQWAGAANTLWWQEGRIHADNTDGEGLVRDLAHFVPNLKNCRILILGAGGAVRGIVKPLLDAGALVTISNRNAVRLGQLMKEFDAHLARADSALRHALTQIPWSEIERGELAAHYDLLINGTSAGLGQAAMEFVPTLFRGLKYAYDLQYRAGVTPFCAVAQTQGVATRDGLGMLLEQAAEAFYIWRGVRPETASILAALRTNLA